MIRTVGVDGFVISFGDKLHEASNRAALAFRAAIEDARIDGVLETSSTLVSAYVRFDPLACSHADLHLRLSRLIDAQDWAMAVLPQGRRSWRIPVVLGGAHGPQLALAAQAAGLTEAEAILSISQSRLRVQTIGFAPGMPYLGELPGAWDIPRKTDLNPKVPAGGLCVALRQLVLFPVETQTGWHHIGQTAVRVFDAQADAPFMLRPGDEVQFSPVGPQDLAPLFDAPHGGAEVEMVP